MDSFEDCCCSNRCSMRYHYPLSRASLRKGERKDEEDCSLSLLHFTSQLQFYPIQHAQRKNNDCRLCYPQEIIHDFVPAIRTSPWNKRGIPETRYRWIKTCTSRLLCRVSHSTDNRAEVEGQPGQNSRRITSSRQFQRGGTSWRTLRR